jgi:riboflavin synthase
MFTGLVQAIGTVVRVDGAAGSCTRLVVAAELGTLVHGESVSIDGACMTIADPDQEHFGVDVMPESLTRTTLGQLRPGDRVNLERALCVGDRLGGHLVSGHIDDLAHVESIEKCGQDHRVTLSAAAPLLRYIPEKGSVTLAGVSLTVSNVREGAFEVALIPVTLEHTTLGALAPGDRLNLEVDLVARYLEGLTRPEIDEELA